jgi:hypothetical protein
VPLIGVRAAVTPPRSDRPGYYLILGMRFEKNESGKHPLIFLGEHEDELQSSLFKRFYNDAARLAVERVYVDQGNPGFFSGLWLNFRDLREVRVSPALHPEDVDYGLSLIREWLQDDALDVPKYNPTILRQQLGSLTTETLELGTVIDPLRYLVSGFTHHQPTIRRGGQVKADTAYYYG